MSIKIEFEQQTPHGMFRDCITLQENHTLTEQDIETLKQQRIDAWIAEVTAVPPDEPEIIEINGEFYQKIKD